MIEFGDVYPPPTPPPPTTKAPLLPLSPPPPHSCSPLVVSQLLEVQVAECGWCIGPGPTVSTAVCVATTKRVCTNQGNHLPTAAAAAAAANSEDAVVQGSLWQLRSVWQRPKMSAITNATIYLQQQQQQQTVGMWLSKDNCSHCGWCGGTPECVLLPALPSPCSSSSSNSRNRREKNSCEFG
jgi:hypothetical protein